MSEGLLLPPLSSPRGTVRPEPERLARLDLATPQILAAVRAETDEVAVMATLACLLFETFDQASFCGFYRRIGPRTLAVGPYQGPMGCLRIDFDRGVCGAAARTATVQRVPDVSLFPGHIACDDATRSELVVPVLRPFGEVRGVLDLDARELDAFSEAEAGRLVALLAEAFRDVA